MTQMNAFLKSYQSPRQCLLDNYTALDASSRTTEYISIV